MENINYAKSQFLGHDLDDIKEHYPDYDIHVLIKDGEVVGIQTSANEDDTTIMVEVTDNIITSILN